MPDAPPEPDAPYVACPNCGSPYSLVEQQLKTTWQPVHGLRADGDADDYSSFDYDDQIVVGYSCRSCDWMDITGPSPEESERMSSFVAELLQKMIPATPIPEEPA